MFLQSFKNFHTWCRYFLVQLKLFVFSWYIKKVFVYWLFHQNIWNATQTLLGHNLQWLFQAKTESNFRTLPWMTFFFKNLFYQNNCKEAIKIEGGQIRGALFNYFVVKKCPFCIFQMLPSVSKITPDLVSLSWLISFQTQTFKMDLGPFKKKVLKLPLNLQYEIGPKSNNVKIPDF